jgi:Transposase DDE domain group 1
VSATTPKRLEHLKRRIKKRLADQWLTPRTDPMIAGSNIHYEVAGRTSALAAGGIGVILQVARAVGLVQALDRHVDLFKVHMPYTESDHILNIACNILAGGTCLQDLELRRNDEVYLDALGTQRIPDPTTAGDFCRRFRSDQDVLALMAAINVSRLKVWKQQPPEFFERAVIDADGLIAPTDGQRKQGIGLSYKGLWGYHPLLISLANTKEVLFLVNRSGNRPSHEQADEYLDKAIELCLKGGFRNILLRGDTDFSQSWKLDGWDAPGNIKFILGFDAKPNLKDLAAALPESDWKRLERPPRYQVKTSERERRGNVKEAIVVKAGYTNQVLLYEDVATFDYQPVACKQKYRMVALRKTISVRKGEQEIRVEHRYFFYITNDRSWSAEQIVFQANDRCDQENLIAQLKGKVRAMYNPVHDLHGNWAYMVMASLAWTLKSWCALLLPVPEGRCNARYRTERQELLKMEFKRFVNSMIQLPCQIVKTGRRIVYRILSWNPWASSLVRLSEAMRQPMLC